MSLENRPDIKMLLKDAIYFFSFSAIGFLIAGSLLLAYNTNISQTCGYVSFLFILLGVISGLIYIGCMVDRSSSYEINSYPVTSDSVPLTFIVFNFIAATIIVIVILQKMLFTSALSIYGNPNINLSTILPFPFSLYTGYTGNGQGFIVQNLFVYWESFVFNQVYIYNRAILITEL